ncbi:hypothetical protein CYMTET_3837 [Cymbomonas tetramitiformis]|uniref:Exostosin GT47 domain-containing protein n=1 Tax=Cymbomonas tetramitiformis TaxID=36881 RepID=A0AAE0LL39_9CHLO|nr:hypothetical protein CYMTET_3837 [Cymbomonas tetramitiformis]|eukprot:gene20284-24289_t
MASFPAHGLLAAIEYVRATWPFWNASDGADHLLASNHDTGACSWPKLARQAIALTSFGCAGNGCGHNPSECFDPAKDVPMPPSMPGPQYIAANAHQHSQHFTSRENFFYFAGRGVGEHSEKESDAYSHGVRQQVYKHHHGRPGWVMERMVDREADMFKSSTFCLAPMGHGWGSRLYKMLGSGCIPVIIQDDMWHVGQVEELLDYPAFSVTVLQKDIPTLNTTLESIPQEKLQSMAFHAVKYFPRFFWKEMVRQEWPGDEEPDAFQVVLATLKAKALRRDTRLSKEKQDARIADVRAFLNRFHTLDHHIIS